MTKYACAICSEYGHYTHHCPALPRFRQTLAAVCQNFQNNPRPATSSSNITDIRYVTTSVNESMRCPFSLCDSLAHFTYQCPMILEYRQCQFSLIHQPTEAITDITSSLEDLHVISPKLEALPTPPWFLDDISKDLPRNPPNSPAHSPTDTLHPTTTSTPQYFNIWFMSSELSPSPSLAPSASPSGGNHTVTELTPHDPLYSQRFQCNEEIIKEINHPDFPWDVLHHCALFSPREAPIPPNHNPIYTIETKDFIPSGHIDWFNNPIPAPDAFEEGNMANISPTIKIDISIKNGIVEEITIGVACTPQEIATYKSLFQEYRDIILQEYDLEFSTPKSKKALILTELVTALPSDTTSAPVNISFTSLQMILGMETFSSTYELKILVTIYHEMIVGVFTISPPAISSSETSYTGGASTPFFVDA
jgi:hypothetical protein